MKVFKVILFIAMFFMSLLGAMFIMPVYVGMPICALSCIFLIPPVMDGIIADKV